MSIVIKGMEVPQNCAQCFLRVGGCKERIYMETRPKRCPIEPLATINTDTISRQAAIDSIAHATFNVIIGGRRGFQNYKEEFEKAFVGIRDKYVETLKALPSAQPERDIPMKPNETIDSSWGIRKKQAVCPKCDYYLGHVEFIGNPNGKKVTYCETCGQAIDWEGGE